MVVVITNGMGVAQTLESRATKELTCLQHPPLKKNDR